MGEISKPPRGLDLSEQGLQEGGQEDHLQGGDLLHLLPRSQGVHPDERQVQRGRPGEHHKSGKQLGSSQEVNQSSILFQIISKQFFLQGQLFLTGLQKSLFPRVGGQGEQTLGSSFSSHQMQSSSAEGERPSST